MMNLIHFALEKFVHSRVTEIFLNISNELNNLSFMNEFSEWRKNFLHDMSEIHPDQLFIEISDT